MRGKKFERVVIVLQFFLRQQSVDIVVARRAQPEHPRVNLLAIEILFVAFVAVPRARNQMVFGAPLNLPPA